MVICFLLIIFLLQSPGGHRKYCPDGRGIQGPELGRADRRSQVLLVPLGGGGAEWGAPPLVILAWDSVGAVFTKSYIGGGSVLSEEGSELVRVPPSSLLTYFLAVGSAGLVYLGLTHGGTGVLVFVSPLVRPG